MRIAVMSDTRLPTSWAYPGHGLGKVALLIGEGLASRGHEVTVFAGEDSYSEIVDVQTATSEPDLIPMVAAWEPTVVVDGGHYHQAHHHLACPVLNYSQDRERHPGPNAVYASYAQAMFFGEDDPVVIHQGLPLNGEFSPEPQDPPFLLFLWPVDIPHKGADMAIRVAGRAGMPLVLAGTGNIWHPGFIGPVSGEDKAELLAGATALLAPGQIENAPVVCLEAGAYGTPVVGLNAGGIPEYVQDGVSGYVCHTEGEMVAAVAAVRNLDRASVRDWVATERSIDRMMNGWEHILSLAIGGGTW